MIISLCARLLNLDVGRALSILDPFGCLIPSVKQYLYEKGHEAHAPC
jgi:hypothetical protein